jgi:MATE family multidrug resistance protein
VLKKITFSKDLIRELIRLGSPIVLTNLAYTLLGVVDTFLMGRVSTLAVGAVGLASVSYLTVSFILRGLVGGVLPFVSRMYGAGELKQAGRFFKYFICIAVFISPMVFLFPWIFRLFFLLIKPNVDVVSSVLIYSDIRRFELPFTLINTVINGFLIGIGNSRLPMLTSWFSVIVNIVASYILIFGKLGFPSMGIAGVAWGTVIAVALQMVLSLYIVFRKYSVEYRLKSWEWPKAKDLSTMLLVGAPMGLADGLELAAFTAFFSIISNIGSVELAASQIANQISSFAFMAGFALSAATGSMVGRYLGAGKKDLAFEAGFHGVFFGAGLMGIIGLLFLLIPGVLMAPFTNDIEVMRIGLTLLRLMALYQVFDAMNIIFRGALNGAGDTRFTMLLTLLAAWVLFIPGTMFIVFKMNWGVLGAWISAMGYTFLLSLTFLNRFYKGSWQKIRLIKSGI